jgi:hypothetical protein
LRDAVEHRIDREDVGVGEIGRWRAAAAEVARRVCDRRRRRNRLREGGAGARNGNPGSERSDDGAARQRRGFSIADLVL